MATLLGVGIVVVAVLVLVVCAWKGWGQGEDPHPDITADEQRLAEEGRARRASNARR